MSEENSKGPVISPEDPTKEQVKAWKSQYHIESIHVIKIKDERDENKVKKAFLRTPNIDDLSRAQGSERSKAGTYGKSLFENCVLWMHPDIKEKVLLYNAALRTTLDIEVAAEAELEKL